jgi:hypothetical protein
MRSLLAYVGFLRRAIAFHLLLLGLTSYKDIGTGSRADTKHS